MANKEVIITIVIYNLILIGVGLLTKNRNKTQDDFYLANRGLGPWVAALSASASSSSAWTLLGVSGAAYAWGLSAVWLIPGVLFWLLRELDLGGAKVNGIKSTNWSS